MPVFARVSGITGAGRIALGSRLAVLVVGLLAVWLVGYELQPLQFRVSRNEAENLPARFDAGWYLRLARRGYDWNEALRGRPQNVAFFPLYPALMRVSGDLVTVPARLLDQPDWLGGGDARVLWGGVLVSIACFCVALVRLGRLAGQDTRDIAAGRRAVVLLSAWPFAFFFSAPYSEALFLLTSVSTVLAWRESHGLGRAFAWGVAAGLTRSNGWTLAIPLLVDVWRRRREPDVAARLLAATGPVAGMALFSGYVFTLTGRPLEWLSAQEGWGRTLSPFAFITRRVASIVELGPLGYVVDQPVDALTAIAAFVTIATCFMWLRRGHWLEGVLGLCYLAPALAIDLPATGRMTAVVFPTFIMLGRWLTGVRYGIVVGLAAALQAWLAARFFLWQAPF